MARVLVIDDDPSLRRALRLALAHHGHVVEVAATGAQGISEVALRAPDVVVLDLGLPDLDGVEVCTRIRAFSAVPILVLSAADSESRKVAALDAGADDYVTKPFGMAELEARIRVALRRRTAAHGTEPTTVEVGELRVDLVHHEVHLAATPLRLTAREFELLAFLARNVGRVCTYEMILHSVWGEGYGHESQYVHAYVHRLRQKLGAASTVRIETAPGIGYLLQLGEH